LANDTKFDVAASRGGGGTRGARARSYMQHENEIGSIEERHAYLEFSVTRTIRIALDNEQGAAMFA
jgi:hypothetical protein